jgi:hypothetical protein
LLTPERERESVCGEFLICHLSVHIISFEEPLKKKKKKEKKEKKERKEKKRKEKEVR